MHFIIKLIFKSKKHKIFCTVKHLVCMLSWTDFELASIRK